MTRNKKPLVQFTDEELLLFGAEHPIVDAPYLGRLDDSHRQVAIEVALRSLCSHGAVAVNGGTGMELPESVVTMLQVRSCARSALVINKSVADVGVLRYHHFGEQQVVIEDVTDAGAHQFRLVEPADVPDEIDAFCTIEGAADGHGDSVSLSAETIESGQLSPELWGEGVAQLQATVWRADPGASRGLLVLGFLLGTAGSWSSRRVIDPLDENHAEAVVLAPVNVADIGERMVDELLGPAVEGSTGDGWHLMRA